MTRDKVDVHTDCRCVVVRHFAWWLTPPLHHSHPALADTVSEPANPLLRLGARPPYSLHTASWSPHHERRLVISLPARFQLTARLTETRVRSTAALSRSYSTQTLDISTGQVCVESSLLPLTRYTISCAICLKTS